MLFLNILLNSFNYGIVKSTLINKVLGIFFLILASIIGIFFLFEALVPIAGYLESGAIICVGLVIIGTSFLFLGQKKNISLQEDALHKILNFPKVVDVENIAKNKMLIVFLLSVGVGIILSQIKKH